MAYNNSPPIPPVSIEPYRVQLLSALQTLNRAQHTLDKLDDALNSPNGLGLSAPATEPNSSQFEYLLLMIGEESHRLSVRLESLFNRF